MNALSSPDVAPVNERLLIFTVILIQFVNMMDFIMVMPLGPDFAKALNIPLNDIGMVGGIYALTASFAGFTASFFIDRFSRKRAMLFFLFALSIATLGGAFAWDKTSMLFARALAGLFGGPLSALSIAIIADFIPPQRRGQAVGKVMGGFSLATIFGIPFGLELAQRISWHAPFVVTCILGLMVAAFGLRALPYHPPFPNEVMFKQRMRTLGALLRTPIVKISYTLVILSMVAPFLIIPNISAHLQFNLGYPREDLGWLYFMGGLVTLFTMRGVGVLIDRTSSSFVSVLSTVLFALVLLAGFIFFPNPIPVTLVFVGFMVAMTTRNICGQSLYSKIPPPEYRGAYSSLQTSLVHITQAIAAWISSVVLVEQDGRLLHMPTLACVSLAVTLAIPFLFYAIEKRLVKPN